MLLGFLLLRSALGREEDVEVGVVAALEERIRELEGRTRSCSSNETPAVKKKDDRGCKYLKKFRTPDALGCGKAMCREWKKEKGQRTLTALEPRPSEGLAWYASRVVEVALEAMDRGDAVAVDYRVRDANLSTFLRPRLGRWRIGYGEGTEPPVGALPYRQAFNGGAEPRPGYFDAASCALQRLMKPNPPRLNDAVDGFLRIHQTLTAPTTLALGVYVRTLHSEVAGLRQDTVEDRIASGNFRPKERASYLATAACALALENQWRSDNVERVVWFVASDSPALRQRFVTDFSSEARVVETTKAMGLHTRVGLNLDAQMRSDEHRQFNDTLALAEAFADWSLLATVDLAVISTYQSGVAAYTFATTALASKPRRASVFRAPSWEDLRRWWPSKDESPPELHCADPNGFVPRARR